ncbi:tectonin domain-containing protein [Streptomyces alkaliphilus]|uniref:tectonin domain-containing protein n=1 Tax=Streptomyces alkaliphilus TaxID=1472722 RepID=UPI001E5C1049|nr:tectonin domain-containing protein [Streptomyces alkaliphilus]
MTRERHVKHRFSALLPPCSPDESFGFLPPVQKWGAVFRTGRGIGVADWVQISGALTAISAGSRTSVWGVNSAGNIYRYSGNDGSPWSRVPGGLTDIGAAADGTVWGVNANGNIYRYVGDGQD